LLVFPFSNRVRLYQFRDRSLRSTTTSYPLNCLGPALRISPEEGHSQTSTLDHQIDTRTFFIRNQKVFPNNQRGEQKSLLILRFRISAPPSQIHMIFSRDVQSKSRTSIPEYHAISNIFSRREEPEKWQRCSEIIKNS
jgi:hypothetical protein